jgi:hypothetical protein
MYGLGFRHTPAMEVVRTWEIEIWSIEVVASVVIGIV